MTLGSHQRSVGKSHVHLTPRWLIDRLGPFDLDPCAATVRPFDCGRRNLVEAEDGLSHEWSGRVWLNPPFDRYRVGLWIERLAAHGDGIALIHARTETEWFAPIWRDASAILFMSQRLKFLRPDGTEQRADSGAPVVLAAFGAGNADRLRYADVGGHLVTDWDRRRSRRAS